MGQLLPNMISFMMVPLALSSFIEALSIHRLQDKAKLLLASAICLCAIAIAQPNGAFAFGMLAVLYAISRVFYEPGAQHALIDKKRIFIAAAIFAAACVLWGVMHLAPFMQSVVTYVRAASLTPFQAVVSGLLSMFSVRQGVQPFVSLMIVVGVVYTFRHRRHLWLTIAYAAVLIFYMICTTTEGPVKQILTGFWYTDYNRVGTMAALFAIPLAAVGFACCVEWLKRARQNPTAASSSTDLIIHDNIGMHPRRPIRRWAVPSHKRQLQRTPNASWPREHPRRNCQPLFLE